MSDLQDLVAKVLHVATDQWWAEYALVSAGWKYPPKVEPVAFSQRDPLWKNKLLGASYQTIGGWGCAMVCACMVYSMAEPDITPDVFNTILKDHGGFNYPNGEAHLAWDRLPDIFPTLRWEGRKDWSRRLTDAELADIFVKVTAAPLVLWVDFKPTTSKLDTHFVLATERDGDDLIIIDPWDGSHAGLLARYALAGQDLQRAIWGYRHLTVMDAVG